MSKQKKVIVKGIKMEGKIKPGAIIAGALYIVSAIAAIATWIYYVNNSMD